MAAWYVNDHHQARVYRKRVVNTAFSSTGGMPARFEVSLFHTH